MNKASILNDVAFGIEVTNKMRSKLIHRAKKLSGRVCYLCNIHSGAIVGLRLILASDLFQGIFSQRVELENFLTSLILRIYVQLIRSLVALTTDV